MILSKIRKGCVNTLQAKSYHPYSLISDKDIEMTTV